MLCTHPTRYTAVLAALLLVGCGTSDSNFTAPPVFAKDMPITGADFIAKTFPLHYVTINKTTNDLERKTGSIRILSNEQFKISTDELSEIVTQASDGQYVSLTIDAEASFFAPGNAAIFAEDDDKLYSGFFGFETPRSQLPTSTVVNYAGSGHAVAFASGTLLEIPEVRIQPVTFGDTDLSVDFGTGAVTGSVFSSDTFGLDILNGEVSENGITGNLELFIILGTLPFSFEESSGDVTGQFFGPDASGLAGTFEATAGNVGEAPSLDVVGTFLGVEALGAN